jgi:DnaJ-class molecular chaperone
MNMSTTDYYNELGISVTANAKDIKDAYRKLAFEHHPDRNKENPASAEKMKAINEAYAVLSDPKKREAYDAMRRQYGDSAAGRFRNNYTEQDIFKGSDVQQIFEEVARAFGLRGVDEIFKDFYGPGYRTYSVRKPGFTLTGFVFTGGWGKGGFLPKALPFGGLFKKIPAMAMRRLFGKSLPERGGDILENIYISAELAQTGGPYAYYHKKLDKKLIVKLPPGTRSDQRIRLSGMGEGGKSGGAPGDLYLRVRIKTSIGQRIKQMFIGGKHTGIMRKR